MREKEEYIGYRGENIEYLGALFAPARIVRSFGDLESLEIFIENEP